MVQDAGSGRAAYRIDVDGEDGLPLVVDAGGVGDRERLVAWLRERAGWVQSRLTRHGALLLRGFDVADAQAFESVARAIAPGLRADYLGTPTGRLTEHVFRASDLPGGYPIAPHCEMSYLRTPPSRVFFGCLREPHAGTGETPLADFRRVWRALDPALRERFARGGITIVRSFRGPASRAHRRWNLERWDDFFATRDRAVVEAKCAAEGIAHRWTADDGLRLRITQPVARAHPETGETVWYNQFAARRRDAGVARRPGRETRRRSYEPHLRKAALHEVRGRVRAAVDDDHLDGDVAGLPRDRLEAGAQRRRAIARGNDDREQRRERRQQHDGHHVVYESLHLVRYSLTRSRS